MFLPVAPTQLWPYYIDPGAVELTTSAKGTAGTKVTPGEIFAGSTGAKGYDPGYVSPKQQSLIDSHEKQRNTPLPKWMERIYAELDKKVQSLASSDEEDPTVSSSHSSDYLSIPSPSAASVDYFNADLSKLYGMDKNVAYQEALANTAYQRAVKDMQAAGLNPASLFGAGRASPSDGVGYVRASGGSSGGRSSARGLDDVGMTKGEYTALSGKNSLIGTIAGAIAGALIPGLTPSSGAQLGSMIADGATKVQSQR